MLGGGSFATSASAEAGSHPTRLACTHALAAYRADGEVVAVARRTGDRSTPHPALQLHFHEPIGGSASIHLDPGRYLGELLGVGTSFLPECFGAREAVSSLRSERRTQNRRNTEREQRGW